MLQPDLVGKLFGNYRIEEQLGSGGMGTVYRARHLHLDWEAAIKVLHAHLAAHPTFRARFQLEARAVSILEHPNIVRLVDFGDEDGQLYLVMELLTDGSLRTLLDDRTAPDSIWTPELGISLVRQAADGLAYAHGLGMIHRDIKPDNLLLQATPNANMPYLGKLADFGLARLGDGDGMTASGVTLGTPTYMSPEQCQGGQVDHRSDIYSLGVVLYEVTAGRPPFRLRNLSDAIYNHVYVAPPPPRLFRPTVSLSIEEVILRCLAKRPQDRYQSIAEFTQHLDQALMALPGAATSTDVATSPTVFDNSPTPAPFPPSTGATTPAQPLAAAAPFASTPAIDLGGAQLPRVVVTNASGEVVETAELTGEGLTVGRLADNRLLLNDPRISRHHLLIDWDGSRAHVTDIGSSTGTTLAGTTIPAHVARIWEPDAAIQIGNLQLRLVLPAPVSQPQIRQPLVSSAVAASPAPPVERTGRAGARWIVAGALAVVVVAIGVGLLFFRDSEEGSAGVDATEPAGIAATEQGTATAIEVLETTEAAVSTTSGDVTSTGVLPTAISTPETPEGWITLIAADPLVGPLIGQPIGDAVVARTPFQEYERGLIVSLPSDIEGGGVIALIANEYDYLAGTYTRYDTSDLPDNSSEPTDLEPPAGYYLPARTFLPIWQSAPGLSDAIGWATYEEPGDRLVYQPFERGVAVNLEGTSRTWVFYGEVELGSNGPWRAFWNEVVNLDDETIYGMNQIARVSALTEVSRQLGAAISPAEPARIPYQTFDDGLMFMTSFGAEEDSGGSAKIISLVADVTDELGTWRRSPPITDLLDVDTSSLGEPPEGVYSPAYPFDLALASDPELASAMGWPDNSTIYSTAVWQQFEGGVIIWFEYSYRSWVILADDSSAETGDWISYGDE